MQCNHTIKGMVQQQQTPLASISSLLQIWAERMEGLMLCHGSCDTLGESNIAMAAMGNPQ